MEIDLVAKLSDGSHLFGEAKWSASPVGLRDLHRLHAKVESVPHPAWKANARYALFSAGGFDQLLIEAARQERVVLVGPEELFPGLGLRSGVQ